MGELFPSTQDIVLSLRNPTTMGRVKSRHQDRPTHSGAVHPHKPSQTEGTYVHGKDGALEGVHCTRRSCSSKRQVSLNSSLIYFRRYNWYTFDCQQPIATMSSRLQPKFHLREPPPTREECPSEFCKSCDHHLGRRTVCRPQ
ncbi:uncharacterized protein MELLADRAFT_91148 [Melampsora larici-populina 98AG31]|uniref:Uncharacterized protein n=1 Tax=Melampsora larici-populina (strain 98AG31 / pathotype 3-4-7) TaxID=747676 RepID=F4RXZ9_MELLP|nr:uncharacterized protein MELLADRAFT_91148 [Melampsora larici-populina 98AG31]EGG02731.1 hypothetical protein MELLADRAFT_91148 [Melampsora larici-populina 98AG31]